ncbi:hypothetical protein [Vacuolonema iberomarrocanum]|uniref:hypothetical protein n=1 Tax=Vacuolonema iberomarrocanum TaxID=3454632 RepID=UPI0019E4EEE7|nr:hypothetical protein [filamentous cyanobacterium LEGE 07170]
MNFEVGVLVAIALVGRGAIALVNLAIRSWVPSGVGCLHHLSPSCHASARHPTPCAPLVPFG